MSEEKMSAAEKKLNKMAEKEAELMAKFGPGGHFVSKDGSVTADDAPVVEGSYTHVDPDSIDDDAPDAETAAAWRKIVTKTPKRLVKRICAKSGDEFWVATSDLHQCFFSPEVRDEVKKERQKAKRAEKREAEKAEIAQLRKERDELRAQAGLDDEDAESEVA